MHNERYYPEPHIFNPTRFLHNPTCALDETDLDPLNIVFGFGRRYVYLFQSRY